MTMQADQLGAAATSEAAPVRAMSIPRPSEQLVAIMVNLLFWGGVGLYVLVFSMISLQQYYAYLPHALDLGNMTQAFWNTAHGHPFRFQNMRAHINVEAFGTSTRLSFHVEPIIPLLSIIYLIWPHVETLLVMQTVAVASGAIPARLLARRHLGHPLAELAFPLAYLLFPALEAANLYEFHPVTLAAPLLLWAFCFADNRRYTLFALTAVAAMGCKEEIGGIIAMIGLWIMIRNGDRRFGLVIAALGVSWSVIALKVIVPHFSTGESAYWARYLPQWFKTSYPVTQSEVIHFWLKNPQEVISHLTNESSRSYLHRMLYSVGYLALISPLTLVIALPSLALNMLSYEPHMYGGLAHYSAELTPVVIVSAILGTAWLCRTAATYLHLPFSTAVLACSLYVGLTAGINHRLNGLSPLAESFVYPTITAHDKALDRILALIPHDASVSAQDSLNAHLSDRPSIFLFPDIDKGRVDFIVLDATQSTGSTIRVCDLANAVEGAASSPCGSIFPPTSSYSAKQLNAQALLHNHQWNIVAAEDGILLLKRRLPGEPLRNTLPPAFFSFVQFQAPGTPQHPLVARFGQYAELLGYSIDRRETANLRNPDVLITTWWRVLKPLPSGIHLIHYLSDNIGALQVFSDDQAATDWVPLSKGQPGQLYKVTSSPLTVTTNASGQIDLDIGLTTNDAQYQNLGYTIPVRIITGSAPAQTVGGACNCRILKLTTITAKL